MTRRTPDGTRRDEPSFFLAIVAVVVLSACSSGSPGQPTHEIFLQDFDSGTDVQLIGLSIANEHIWWAGGAEGTVVRTLDAGNSWSVFKVPDADSLQFRDAHGVDALHASVLSIGPGEESRIYRTEDGGVTWSLEWKNEDPRDFFDCFDFWTDSAGLVVGDVRDDRIEILARDRRGPWFRSAPERIPVARGVEGAFAASGTCLVTASDSLAWIATGSVEGSRVYRTANRGQSWSVTDLTFGKGHEAAGIMSLAFRTADHGFASGGILGLPDDSRANLLETVDGGNRWRLLEGPQLPNVYGLATSPSAESTRLVAVGPKGMDVSTDDGHTWHSIDKRNYWSVTFVNDYTAVAVGPRGRISLVTFN